MGSAFTCCCFYLVLLLAASSTSVEGFAVVESGQFDSTSSAASSSLRSRTVRGPSSSSLRSSLDAEAAEAATAATAATVMSPSNKGDKMPSTMVASPYSDEELRGALESLLEGSDDFAKDSAHLFGFNREGNVCDSHHLSMLQVITATRILDYRNKGESSESAAPQAGRRRRVGYEDEPRLNLLEVIRRQSPRMALAAEFKRASPSKGMMASSADLDAGIQACMYAEAGADVISVLTEPRWFLGSLDDLRRVREETSELANRLDLPNRPAVLRKDFVVSREMVDEAVAAGADSVLLIVAVLPSHLLGDLIEYCRSLDLEPLVEVHADAELQVAVDAGAKVIGVNNRNLHTFQMDLTTTERAAERLRYQGLEFHHGRNRFGGDGDGGDENESGNDYALCALSGMSTAFQVDRYRQVGVGMCLIGESLMRAPDPRSAIAALCLSPTQFANFLASSQSSLPEMEAGGAGGAGGGAYTQGTQIVKVCGVTRPADAVAACRAGADLIGVIFAEKSKRRVTREQARDVVEVVRAFGERSDRVDWEGGIYSPERVADPVPHLILASSSLVEGTRRPAVVGVFQNQPLDYVRKVVEECGLDLVQLHGSEGMAAANCKNFGGVPAIRVVDIAVDPETGKASETAVEAILESVTNDPIAILLDTSIKGSKEGGGTGVAFDWSIAQRLQDAGLPVLIAGGLTPESVRECVGTIRPFGVDVSSGVEKEPGRKDLDKVKAFVKSARQAAEEANKGF